MLTTKMQLLCPEEKKLPYAKYFEIPLEPISEKDRKLLERPLKLEETLPLSRALDMIRLDGTYPEHNIGYCVLPDRRTYMACMEFLPGITPAMMDWYFKWIGKRPVGVPEGHGNLRYKIWCPPCHWDSEDLDQEPANKAKIMEALDVEKEENSMIHIHIKRFPISIVGITAKMKHQMKTEGYFMALESGMSPQDEPGGIGINFFRPKAGGCEWFSRSWGGYAICDGKIVEIPPGPVPSYESMRMELFHNLTERRQLPKFLSELYQEYGEKPLEEN